MIIRPTRTLATRSMREFEVKTLEDFAARTPHEERQYERLARPILDRVPFQPDWPVANGAMSWEAYTEVPPVKRHLLRLTDGQYHRLELLEAREKDTRERWERRWEEERSFVRKLTTKLDEAAWQERHDLWVETYYKMLDRSLKFIRDRRAQREAVLEYRRALEKVTQHEYEILERFAEAREQRHKEWHSLWYRDMYQLTSNNGIVRLPQYGRSLQFVLGQIFRREGQGMALELLEWHLGNLYTLTPNGVIVPLPLFGLPSSIVLAGMDYARDMRQIPATRRQLAKGHAETVRQASVQTAEHQDHILNLQRARQRAQIRKLIEARRQRPLSTWHDQAREMQPQLAHESLVRREKAESLRVAKDSLNHDLPSPTRRAESEAPVRDLLDGSLGEPSGSRGSAELISGVLRERGSNVTEVSSGARPGDSKETPRVLGAAERPQVFREGIEKIVVKVEDDGSRERDRLKVKRLQENLAAQAAGAISLLNGHVDSSPRGEAIRGSELLPSPDPLVPMTEGRDLGLIPRVKKPV